MLCPRFFQGSSYFLFSPGNILSILKSWWILTPGEPKYDQPCLGRSSILVWRMDTLETDDGLIHHFIGRGGTLKAHGAHISRDFMQLKSYLLLGSKRMHWFLESRMNPIPSPKFFVEYHFLNFVKTGSYLWQCKSQIPPNLSNIFLWGYGGKFHGKGGESIIEWTYMGRHI